MEDATRVTRLPLPREVVIDGPISDMAPTPNEMRAIKKASNLRLDYLFGADSDADADDQVQAFTWLALVRAGYEPTWAEAGDVRLVQREANQDPTNAER